MARKCFWYGWILASAACACLFLGLAIGVVHEGNTLVQIGQHLSWSLIDGMSMDIHSHANAKHGVIVNGHNNISGDVSIANTMTIRGDFVRTFANRTVQTWRTEPQQITYNNTAYFGALFAVECLPPFGVPFFDQFDARMSCDCFAWSHLTDDTCQTCVNNEVFRCRDRGSLTPTPEVCEQNVTCVCNNNWTSADCSVCSPYRNETTICGECLLCEPSHNPCIGPGSSCSVVDDACEQFSCECAPGRTGRYCEQFVNTTECVAHCIGDECNHCGTCYEGPEQGWVAVNDSESCGPCSGYWSGAFCHECKSPAHLSNETHQCTECLQCANSTCQLVNNGQCTPSPGCMAQEKPQCACIQGWIGQSCSQCALPWKKRLSQGVEFCDQCSEPADVIPNFVDRCVPFGTAVLDITRQCQEVVCECHEGYAGIYCRECAQGFWRDPISLACIPCDCENGQTCNRGTGVCQCEFPFAGKRCEETRCAQTPARTNFFTWGTLSFGLTPSCICLPGLDASVSCGDACALPQQPPQFGTVPRCYTPTVMVRWVDRVSATPQLRPLTITSQTDFWARQVFRINASQAIARDPHWSMAQVQFHVGLGCAAALYIVPRNDTRVPLRTILLGNAGNAQAQEQNHGMWITFPLPAAVVHGVAPGTCASESTTLCLVVVVGIGHTNQFNPLEKVELPEHMHWQTVTL